MCGTGCWTVGVARTFLCVSSKQSLRVENESEMVLELRTKTILIMMIDEQQPQRWQTMIIETQRGIADQDKMRNRRSSYI